MKKTCRFGQHFLIPFFLGEASLEVSRKMEAHLRNCPHCQEDLALLERILQTTREMRRDLEETVEEIDWQEFALRVAKAAQKGRPSPSLPESRNWRSIFLSWQPVAAGIIAGLFLGIMAMLWLFREEPRLPEAVSAYHVSPAFLERVDQEAARREILDYLEKSHLVLLAWMQSSDEQEVGGISPFPAERIQELLARKKYLNPRLNSFRLAKARAILEEIDTLLLELSWLRDSASAEETRQITRLIEERRLLLKIQLLQRELEESEDTT